MFWFWPLSSSSVTKTSMWQIYDDVATCDVADDAGVSFQMLSHKVRGNQKNKIRRGTKPKNL